MRSLKGTTGRPVKLARALGVRGQRPRSGPHKRRNTTVASPAQLSGVATGAKLVQKNTEKHIIAATTPLLKPDVRCLAKQIKACYYYCGCAVFTEHDAQAKTRECF
jgi:hypothetical protein